MTRAIVVLGAWVVLLVSAASGQRLNVRTAAYFERYTSDSTLFSAVSEFAVPVSVSGRLGRWGNLTVSGGFVKVDLDVTADSSESISGPLDTEARLAIALLPGRLTLLVSGAIPTGIQSVERAQLAMLAAVSRDIIGFAINDLGAGGYLGTGAAAVFPVGKMALGLSACYRHQFAYQPLSEEPDATLQPGAELRVRAGLEGPLGQRTYLRLAGIYAARQRDVINDSTRNGVGNRLTGYLTLNQGIGQAATVTLYAFDVFRSDPQIEQTAIGAAYLPRGNLLVAGVQFAQRVGARTNVVPTVEYRLSHTAPDTSAAALERAGSSLRLGLDVRRAVSSAFNLVLNGSYLMADVQSIAGLSIDAQVRGFRAALLLELRR